MKELKAFWDIGPCSLVEVDRRCRGLYSLMMEAVRTSETSVYLNEITRRYISEG
jgi:hypothetical protein